MKTPEQLFAENYSGFTSYSVADAYKKGFLFGVNVGRNEKRSELRRVNVFEFVKNEDRTYTKRIVKQGYFHQWGSDYEDYESGPGNFSTAIVEMDDGTVENVYVEMISFVERD